VAVVVDPPVHRFVIDTAGLVDVAAALAEAPWVALDTESNSMHVHHEQVCLLQVNAGGAVFVVDTLALGVDPRATPIGVLDVLAAGLRRSDRPLYLHGGEYDVACLRRDFGLTLCGVFDTQQAASLLGFEKTGYGSVVERFCGVTLGKAYATYDWGTRPLDPRALAYAIDDVVHLPRVADELRRAVAEAGIDDEVAVANAVVAATPWSRGFDPQSLWRLRDVERAPAAALKVLSRLLRWREDAAAVDNIPAGRLVNNEVLLSIARHRAATIEGLKQAGVKAAVLARHGEAAVAAICAADADDVPVRPASVPPSPAQQGREARLKQWRRDEAERRSAAEGRPVPLQLVLPARALDHLRVHGAANLDDVPQLGAARRARYGDVLRRLCGDAPVSSPTSSPPSSTSQT
jgi:ribonuclease D